MHCLIAAVKDIISQTDLVSLSPKTYVFEDNMTKYYCQFD